MWLTKNEKKVLKLLIGNAKLSDTSIANQLNISSQAVGQIRKKLEEEIIEGYTVNINPSKLGINVFVIGPIKFNCTIYIFSTIFTKSSLVILLNRLL